MTIRVIIIASIALAFISSLIHFRNRPIELKVFAAFLGVSVASEAIAFYLAWVYNNNMAVFHIFSPILLLVLGIYFTYVSPSIEKYKLGWCLCAATISFSIFNTSKLQPLNTMNSNYLLLQGLCVCTWGFFTLYDFQRDDRHDVRRNYNFWITLILIAREVGNYLLYIIIKFFELSRINPSNIALVYTALWITGVLAYMSMAIVFFLSPVTLKTRKND